MDRHRPSSAAVREFLTRVAYSSGEVPVVWFTVEAESFRYTSLITRCIGRAEIRVAFSKLVRVASF